MRESSNQIVLNGSHGEGGGALMRSAVAIASITQQPVLIHNVRGGLRKKGLTPEDLTFIEMAADSTSAERDSAYLDSTEFSFAPHHLPRPLVGQYDIHGHKKGTVPGNAVSLLTSILPVLARAKGYSEVAVYGETHNEKTVSFDAFDRSTLAAMRRFGVYAFPRLMTAGFGYGSRGEVSIEIEPSGINAQEWMSRGKLLSLGATMTLSDIPEKVGIDALKSIETLAQQKGLEIETDLVQVKGTEKGACTTVWAEFENGLGSGTAMLTKERTMDEVASLAFHRFMEWYETENTVDPFLADQILLLAAQAEGRTVFTTPQITQRLSTMAWVIRQFMPIHITIIGREGQPGTVTIER